MSASLPSFQPFVAHGQTMGESRPIALDTMNVICQTYVIGQMSTGILSGAVDREGAFRSIIGKVQSLDRGGVYRPIRIGALGDVKPALYKEGAL